MGQRAPLDFPHLEDPGAVMAAVGVIARRWILLFCDEWTGDAFRRSDAAEWIREGIWVKRDPMPQMSGDRPAVGRENIAIFHAWRESGRLRWNGGGRPATYHHCVVNPRGREDKTHPCEKPVQLLIDIVTDFTDPDELVLDPFAGSGTTGVACLRLGRRCILIEKSPKYAALARERMRAETQGLTLRDARAGQLPLLAGV